MSRRRRTLPVIAALVLAVTAASGAAPATAAEPEPPEQWRGYWVDAFRFVRAQVLLTAHARGIMAVDTLHADFRDLDGLAPEHRGGMVEEVLHNMRDRCMNLPGGGDPDVRAWLARLLER